MLSTPMTGVYVSPADMAKAVAAFDSNLPDSMSPERKLPLTTQFAKAFFADYAVDLNDLAAPKETDEPEVEEGLQRKAGTIHCSCGMSCGASFDYSLNTPGEILIHNMSGVSVFVGIKDLEAMLRLAKATATDDE